jgi:hypothetical protein
LERSEQCRWAVTTVPVSEMHDEERAPFRVGATAVALDKAPAGAGYSASV